jgi:transposase
VTGQPLVKIGEEITLKLAHKPGNFFIKKIVRPKYAAPQNPDAGISTAFLPDTLLSRCFADESLLADILVNKYADHLPIHRQVEMLAREGVFISRQVMNQWAIKASMALKPIYDAMKSVILDGEYVFCDESPVKMLPKNGGKSDTTFVWVMVGGQKVKLPGYRLYMFYEDRKHCNLLDILGEYKGTLHSDKYGAYASLARAKKYIWFPCWAHIRRKFFEAEGKDPLFRDWVLQKIKDLYAFEEVAWKKNPDERLKIRQEDEIPIIDELLEATKKKLADIKILPKSKLGIAIRYFLGLMDHVKNYTRYPFAHIDNNVAERAIRPLAIGRKNWLFFGNENGGIAASIAYSLIQTCRELDINPRDYLEDVMRRLMGHPANRLEELLPDQWALAKGLLPKPTT